MKGSLNIQVTYDTTRSPSGDGRYDFVTKVTGDPILDKLSLAERQAFDSGIAGHVNEMLAGTHRILPPKEKWLFEDVAKLLFWLKDLYFKRYLEDQNWRENITSRKGIDRIWSNIESTVSETMGNDFAKLLKFPDAKIKFISERYLKKILDAHLKKDTDIRFNAPEIDTVDKLIVFMRKVLEINPDIISRAYGAHIVTSLLKETYSITDDELIFLLQCDGKRSLLRLLEQMEYIHENQIRFIATRADIDPDVFLSQVIATAKVLEHANHERDQQQ